MGNVSQLLMQLTLVYCFYAPAIFSSDIEGQLDMTFQDLCRKANGIPLEGDGIKQCECLSNAKYFDPVFSYCTDDGVREHNDLGGEKLLRLNQISDFSSLMNLYEEDHCHSDGIFLLRASVRVLQHALKYRFAIRYVMSDSWRNPRDLLNEIILLWRFIAEQIDEETEQDQDYQKIQAIYPSGALPSGTFKSFDERIKLCLESGLIPLPVFNYNIQKFFIFPELKKQFFVGVAPIHVGRYSIKQLMERTLHPIRTLFFTGTSSLMMRHDVEHAILMARKMENLGLVSRHDKDFHYSKNKCRAIETIIDNLSQMIDEKTGHKKFTLMLYYMLHEDNLTLNFWRNLNFVEFILSIMQGRNKRSWCEDFFAGVDNGARNSLAQEIYDKYCSCSGKCPDREKYDFLMPLYECEWVLGWSGDIEKDSFSQGLLSTLASYCFVVLKINHERPLKKDENIIDLKEHSRRYFDATLPLLQEESSKWTLWIKDFYQAIKTVSPHEHLNNRWLEEKNKYE
jgi:hypothetical protein